MTVIETWEDVENEIKYAVQAERTRIIKALEGMKWEYQSKNEWHKGVVDGRNQAIDQAIKAVGERSESAANEG